MRSISLFIMLTFTLSAHADMDKEIKAGLDKCHKIDCSDMLGKEKLSCQKSRGLCYRNVLKERVEIWKEVGISAKDRKGVIRSLQQSEAKNKEVLESLENEVLYVQKILKEVQDLKKEVQSLKPSK